MTSVHRRGAAIAGSSDAWHDQTGGGVASTALGEELPVRRDTPRRTERRQALRNAVVLQACRLRNGTAARAALTAPAISLTRPRADPAGHDADYGVRSRTSASSADGELRGPEKTTPGVHPLPFPARESLRILRR